ncbi:MAG TPA: guanylate kinase [Candidatus Paceibacterota bacterium]|nr:guanylate kinase [Candidatus Paceibacterota bacterium]
MEKQGKLVLVIGPTGSGKSALMAHARQAVPGLVFPISCTTRAMRPGEVEGENYFFVTPEEFERRVKAGDFLEWKHTDEKRYGTLKSQILTPLAEGKTVIREVEIRGARDILGGLVPRDLVHTIYIDGGSWEQLEARILRRASMGEVELASRRTRYAEESVFKNEADVVIENTEGKLEEAKQEFEKAIRAIMEA